MQVFFPDCADIFSDFLFTITLLTILLDAETILSPAQWDLMNTIRCSGETLLTLITDILDFSRIEADKMVLVPTEFHLQTVIEAAMEIAGLHAAQKRLQVHIHVFMYTPIVICTHLCHLTRHAAVLHSANKDSLAQCYQGDC